MTDDTSAQVLDAAEGILTAGGFEGLSVRQVADAVGASRQVVYTYFGGMDGLLDALHLRFTERLDEAVRTAGGEPGTDGHLLAAGQAYRDVARAHPALYQLAFERPVAEHVHGPEASRAGRRGFGRIVAAASAWLDVRDGAAPSDVDSGLTGAWPPEATRLARAMWSLNHGIVVLERVGFGEPTDSDAVADEALRALLAGW